MKTIFQNDRCINRTLLILFLIIALVSMILWTGGPLAQ